MTITLAPNPVLTRLGELAERRQEPIAKVLLDALTASGIAPHRWTGTWLRYLDDAYLIEALELLDPPTQ